MSWYREWTAAQLGKSADGKRLERRYWKEDEKPVHVTSFPEMTLDHVQGDGRLALHYFWYKENGKRERQNVFWAPGDVIFEQLPEKPHELGIIYQIDGRDIGHLKACPGGNGFTWDVWLTRDGHSEQLPEGEGVTLAVGRALLMKTV